MKVQEKNVKAKEQVKSDKPRADDPPSITAWREPSLSVGDPVIDQIRERVRRAIVDRYDHTIDDKTAAQQMRGCEIDLVGCKVASAGQRMYRAPEVSKRAAPRVQ